MKVSGLTDYATWTRWSTMHRGCETNRTWSFNSLLDEKIVINAFVLHFASSVVGPKRGRIILLYSVMHTYVWKLLGRGNTVVSHPI